MTAHDPGDYVAPENKARAQIDDMLTRAGWIVQDCKSVNLSVPDVFASEIVNDLEECPTLAESLAKIDVDDTAEAD